MSPLARPITRLASVALITVALASCGSSGSKSADTTAAKSTTTTAAKSTTTSAVSTTETSTTTTSGSTSSSTSAVTPTSGATPSTVVTPTTVVSKKDSPFCNGFADYSNGVSGSTAGATPASLRKVVEASQEAVSTIRADTPGELKGDINTVFDAYDKFVAALDKVDFDVKKLSPTAAKELDAPKVEAASKRVETYVNKECGIDL